MAGISQHCRPVLIQFARRVTWPRPDSMRFTCAIDWRHPARYRGRSRPEDIRTKRTTYRWRCRRREPTLEAMARWVQSEVQPALRMLFIWRRPGRKAITGWMREWDSRE